ncbi:MAG: hypothetical protein ACK4PN_06540 [Allorhizobium sp.]
MLIRTHADFAKLRGKDRLSAAEKSLIENCKIGEPTILGDGSLPDGPSLERAIRADLLRYLILGGCEVCRPHEHGVLLQGAWIEGELDLSFAEAKGAVSLGQCGFGAALTARQTRFDFLQFDGSSLPALDAEGAFIKGDVVLDDLKSTGKVSFSGADVGGQLSCVGAELNGGEGIALNVQGASVKGDVVLDELKSTREVSLLGAEIGGQLSCVGAELNGGEGTALNAQAATIRGGVFLRGLRSTGQVSFSGAEIGVQLLCEGAELNGREGDALIAQGATIRGDVILAKLKSTGAVLISGADIGGQLSCVGGELNGGEQIALNAQGASVKGDVVLDELKSAGGVLFSGAEVGGQLSCDGAELDGGERQALNAQDATIKGGVFFRGLTSAGEVSFQGARIACAFTFEGAKLDGKEGTALNAGGAMLKGFVVLDRMTSTGEVSFMGAEIDGQISCHGVQLNGGKKAALNAQRMIVKGSLFWRGLKSVVGEVDLSAARIGDLADDKPSWDQVTALILVGLTYENLVGPIDLAFRKSWLRKGATPLGQFHAQPYQQLARFYRETGHRQEAREILIAKEREQRKAVRASIRRGRSGQESVLEPNFQIVIYKLWDEMMRAVAGYGYKPWLSLWWLGGLVAAMTLWSHFVWQAGDFAPNSAVVLTSADWKIFSDGTPERPPSDDPAIDWSSGPGRDYETFYSFAYAMDVVVPVLELGQMEAWAPSPARGAWGYWLFYGQKIFVVLGWVVTALAAAAVTGMIRRDD